MTLTKQRGSHSNEISTKQNLLLGRPLTSHPELRDGPQIPLIAARDTVFLAVPHSKYVLPGGPGLKFLDERSIHEHGSMNSYKAVRLELFGQFRDGAPKRIGIRSPPEKNIVALRFDSAHFRGINEKNLSVCFDCNPGAFP